MILETDINLLDFHKISKSKNGEPGTPYDIYDDKIAEFIISEIPMFVMHGKPYIYKNGVYHLDEDCNILRFYIKQMIIQEVITINRINRVLNLILVNPRLKKDMSEVNKYPSNWINFENGMFDVKDWIMYEHDPKYMSINQIPHSFFSKIESQYESSVTKVFIESTIPADDDREMLLQYMGYCMTKDTSQQKFLCVTGIGGTGKSVIIRMIEKIVGKENLCSLSLQELNKRFYPTSLFGKLLNSCADIPRTALEETDIIKKITGEDCINGEYKGGAVFPFKSYAKLLFSANEIPVTLDEKSNAFFRRLLILKIDKRGTYIENLEYKLQSEISVFLLEAVNALRRMYQSGKVVESSKSIAAVEELYMDSDTVYEFLKENFEPKGAENSLNYKIERTQLYKMYTQHCEDNGRQSLSAQGFYKNLRNKGFSECTVHGKRYFKGLKSIETVFQPALETPF